jgi:ribosome-binding factor A
MTSRRTQKAAEAIREVVSMAILTDLKDPRVRDVTVTFVEVSPDMRQAKVHVSIMGDETRQNLSLRGLQNSAGFLQSKVAKRIDTRYTPRLTFVLDLGVKQSIEINRILQSVLPRDDSAGDEPVGDEGDLHADDVDAGDDDTEVSPHADVTDADRTSPPEDTL